jgi:hypothetical protein
MCEVEPKNPLPLKQITPVAISNKNAERIQAPLPKESTLRAIMSYSASVRGINAAGYTWLIDQN